MPKLLSALAALSLIAALAGGVDAKNSKTPPKGASPNASTMGQTMSTKCAPGKKYVKGYTKKDGTKVKGYCR